MKKTPILLAGIGLALVMAKGAQANEAATLKKDPFQPIDREAPAIVFPQLLYCEPLCTKEPLGDGFKKMPKREGGFGGPAPEPILAYQPPERYVPDIRTQMKFRSIAHGRF